MKKIFITGASGFIGSHLVERALKKKFKVTALVKYNSKNNWGWLEDVKSPNLKVVTGDIRDSDMMQSLIKKHDYVIHLAALIGIPYSYHAVESYYETNVMGTLNILNACKKSKPKKILVTSTSEVYGTAIYTPIDEKHPLQAQSPYSASKIASDKLAEAFANSFDLPIVVVRPFNAYGPRQSARAIIPTIMSQIIEGNQKVEIGNSSPYRDYNFVEDIAEAFIKILESKKTINQVINISSGKEIQIKQLAKKIIKISEKKIILKFSKKRFRPIKSEVNRLLGSNKKILKLTTWKPKTRLDIGLKKTFDWIKENKKIHKIKSKLYNI